MDLLDPRAVPGSLVEVFRRVTGVGVIKTAQTPKDVIWQRGKAQLWRYRVGTPTKPIPIVIVYSIISRSYMFDLYPDHSFVQSLSEMGYDVYLLDWGVADAADSQTRLETLTDEYIPAALRAALDESGAPSLFLVGYCFGGSLSLISCSRDMGAPVSGLILMATPVDYSEMALFTRLLGPDGSIQPEDILDSSGNVPASACRVIFRTLKPTSEIAAKAALVQRITDKAFVRGYHAMNQWSQDQIPFPGQVFRQVHRGLFQENGFVTGTLRVGGRAVDLSKITLPVLILNAEKDHLVPNASSLAGPDVLGSEDLTVVTLPFGHVGMVVGRGSSRRTLDALTGWIDEHTIDGSGS